MRKPCVVSNVIGNKDVIHNGVNGNVCDEVDDYVAAIRTIQNTKFSHVTDNAYTDILQYYNTRVMAQNYNEIYKNSLTEKEKVVCSH